MRPRSWRAPSRGCGALGPVTEESGAAPSQGATDLSSARHTFDGNVLYRLLVGELASHRGDFQLALTNYLDVAKETRDAGVAARATKLAVFAHSEELALEAARLWNDVDSSSVEARQVLASLLIRAGDIDSAVEHLNEIVATRCPPLRVRDFIVPPSSLARRRTQRLRWPR